MLEQELLDLAIKIFETKAETQSVEVKAAHDGCPRLLYDTLSGYSFQDGGGVILFGLDEAQDFRPVGVYDLQNLQQKVTEQCQQMEPAVRAVFTFARLDGCDICSAEIPGLDLAQRPCYYTGVGRTKGAYFRVGEADLPMTDYELYCFESFRQHLHDDERSVPRAHGDVFDRPMLDRYLNEMKEDRPGFARLTREQALEMLAIQREGQFTLAAVLNFCVYPQGFFPQLAITAIVVPGREIGDPDKENTRFLDNRRIEGTLPDMLQGALSFCKRNMKTRTVINPDTGERTDKTEYPTEALREAILNALIHRDYSHYTEGTPVQIDFFSDRVEIHSPGNLYGRMTVEQLGHARPDLRNPALATMAEFLLKTENRYSGIPTMRREMAAAGLPEPRFENRRNEFVVTFYNQPNPPEVVGGSPTGEQERDLLQFCQIPRSRQEIADYLGIGTVYYAMQRYVRPLLDEGKLAMEMPDNPHSRNQRYVKVQE